MQSETESEFVEEKTRKGVSTYHIATVLVGRVHATVERGADIVALGSSFVHSCGALKYGREGAESHLPKVNALVRRIGSGTSSLNNDEAHAKYGERNPEQVELMACCRGCRLDEQEIVGRLQLRSGVIELKRGVDR